MDSCIFCKIIAGEIPSTKVAESDLSLVFENIKPVAEHHVLVVPKTHIATFLDFDIEHKDIFMDMVKISQKVIKERGIAGGYKLNFNGGKYQSVAHVHWHLVGGKLEDEEDILNNT